jgi:hypothetical protein
MDGANVGNLSTGTSIGDSVPERMTTIITPGAKRKNKEDDGMLSVWDDAYAILTEMQHILARLKKEGFYG